MIRWALCLTALTLVPAGLAAQDEDILRRAFEGRLVAPRLDMPATERGVNVYPYRQVPLGDSEVRRDIARHGVGVPAGRAARVTRIRVKGKHIEFQLGEGGDRQEPSVSSPYVAKSREERRLEDEIEHTSDKQTKERLKERLRDLQDRRRRERDRLEALARIEQELRLSRHTPEEWALMAGARFNVRFDSKVPATALTPEGLEALMERWVDFEPTTGAERTTTTVAPGELRKGMPESEVKLDLGPPIDCHESRAGDLDIRSCQWSLPAGHLEARFVEGVLVKYTLSSEAP